MRSLCLSLALLSAFASNPARGDVVIMEGDDRAYGPNLLLVNPGDLLNGVITLEYERALSPWFGVTIGASLWAFAPVWGGTTYTAFVPEVGARIHFVREAPAGLFIGPTLSAGYVANRSDGPVVRVFAWGLGVSAGYNFVFGRHFTFQLGIGGRVTDYGNSLVWSPRLLLGLGAVF